MWPENSRKNIKLMNLWCFWVFVPLKFFCGNHSSTVYLSYANNHSNMLPSLVSRSVITVPEVFINFYLIRFPVHFRARLYSIRKSIRSQKDPQAFDGRQTIEWNTFCRGKIRFHKVLSGKYPQHKFFTLNTHKAR